MQTAVRNIRAELKATDEGIVEGYGSVFDVVDSYDDVVEKGAFNRTLKEGRAPAMLWQHDTAEPIGVWESLREDDTGLFVKGRFAKTQRGQEAFELVKIGALTGLSIGYSVKDARLEKNGVRVLTDIELWEVSPVTFPANDAARITRVKAGDIKTERDFERFLRDAGFSRTDAKRIARVGFDDSLRDAAGTSDAVNSISAALASLNSIRST
jgi:uncharacterized protein